MLLAKGRRILCGLGLWTGLAHAQCYDLTSVQLYEVKGRFQEWWDKPIWNAKPGEGNFHLDEQDWMGGVGEFIIFAIGQVQRTDAGWVPLRKSGVPETWCDWTPQRSDVLCYSPPFVTPSANALRLPPKEHSANTWTLTPDGLLRFNVTGGGDRPLTNSDARVDSMVKYLNQGRSLSEMFDAVLDLNTGAYSAVSRSLFTGYFRRFPGSGVKVLRDTVLSAKVKLTPQACTASMLKATLKAELQDDEAHPLPICAARFKTDGGKSSFEFIINPRNAVSPRGCIAAHEGPMPQPDMPVAQNAGQAFGASIPGKPR